MRKPDFRRDFIYSMLNNLFFLLCACESPAQSGLIICQASPKLTLQITVDNLQLIRIYFDS